MGGLGGYPGGWPAAAPEGAYPAAGPAAQEVAGHGAYRGGPGYPSYGPPPYASPPGDPPFGGSAPGRAYGEHGRPRLWSRLGAGVAAALIAAGTGAGVLIGHAAWAAPAGSGGLGQTSSVSAGSSGTGDQVSAGLVDINVTLGYQGASAAGTGMVLTPDGEVLTNNHVIQGATRISATDVGNGTTYTATVVGYDSSHDVAVLQLAGASGLSTVQLGDSATVGAGQRVVAIGNAGGVGGTPSSAAGTVTAVDQTIVASDAGGGSAQQLTGLIATDADVAAGDSGGPLVDSTGHVIGMDTAGSTGRAAQDGTGQGYAIPIDQAANIATQIEAGTSSSTVHIGATAFLGVGLADTVGGTQITSVLSSGPAAQAGLAAGDTITSIDGQAVTSAQSLTDRLLTERPGAKIQVRYLDGTGTQHTTTVQLASGPPQ
jgi:S1-C subfamily serine protease